MLLDVLPRRLRSTLCKLPVTQSVDYTGQSAAVPLAHDECVTVFTLVSIRARRCAELEPSCGCHVCARTQPSLTHDVGTASGQWPKLKFVHQAIDRAQACAKTSSRGIAVSERTIEIWYPGPGVFRLDLYACASLLRVDRQPEDAASSVPDKVGTKLAYYQPYLVALLRRESNRTCKTPGGVLRMPDFRQRCDVNSHRLTWLTRAQFERHFFNVIWVPAPAAD